MKENIKIDKNIPLSNKRMNIHSYPWKDMKIGDSFYAEMINNKNIGSFQGSLMSAARSFCLTNNLNWKFATRRSEDGKGIRIWRLQ